MKSESYGQSLAGYLLETAFKSDDAWTLFSRAEFEQNNELTAEDESIQATALPAPPGPTRAYGVGKISLGAIRDWRAAEHLKVGVGALYDWAFVPPPIGGVYGPAPHGVMGFVRVKVD